MTQTLILKKFKEAGLSLHEAKSYMALLERETLTVAEVSKIGGIPRANAYEALEKLMAKGLCVERPGATKRYSAADPAILQEKTLDRLTRESELELQTLAMRKNAAVESVTALVSEISPLYHSNRSNIDPLEFLEVFKDPHQIHRKFIQLCSEATREIVMFSKPPYASANQKQKDEQDDGQFNALRRGVKIRSIYEIPSSEPERVPFIEAIPKSVSQGEEARVIEELPIKLAVVDDKIALYVMEDPVLARLSVTTIVAENSALAKSFKVLFETYWAQARDYYVIGDRRIELSSQPVAHDGDEDN